MQVFSYLGSSMSIIFDIYRRSLGVWFADVSLYILFTSAHGGSIMFVRFSSDNYSSEDRYNDFEENIMYVIELKDAVNRFSTLLFNVAM